MEAAIARGQGVSATGVALESLTLEVILPSSVAMVIDIETDNKARSLMDLRSLIKGRGGTVSPTAYLFQKKGRVLFEKDERGLGVDEVLDDAIEAGAEDVETDEDGNIIVWTEPNKTIATAEMLGKSLGLKAQSSEIVWDANEDTKIALEDDSAVKALSDCVEALQDNPNVQGIYVNAGKGNVDDDMWAELQSKIAV